jgi:sulfur relay (sulfurtransferase) complex TusBCD TusD component (DsrE family)
MVTLLNRSALVAAFASFMFLVSTGNALAASSEDGLEDVVISLHTDPTRDPEPACVALQIGINLLLSEVPVGDAMVPVTPADAVKLFLTTGGVELVNPDNNIYKRAKPKAVCDTPAGPSTASLQQLLNGFVANGGEVVICPLCANARGITDPTFGAPANAEQIHNLFLFADKVINF